MLEGGSAQLGHHRQQEQRQNAILPAPPTERCLFIGDNPRWDILGARRAGMTPVFIDRTGEQSVDGEYQSRSLFELDDVLAKIDTAKS